MQKKLRFLDFRQNILMKLELNCLSNFLIRVLCKLKIMKITLNMGLGEAVTDKKVVERAMNDMTLIGGQKPIVTYSRKSIAGFKIRDGWPIGVESYAKARKDV